MTLYHILHHNDIHIDTQPILYHHSHTLTIAPRRVRALSALLHSFRLLQLLTTEDTHRYEKIREV